jgi:hypothetical protein
LPLAVAFGFSAQPWILARYPLRVNPESRLFSSAFRGALLLQCVLISEAHDFSTALSSGASALANFA